MSLRNCYFLKKKTFLPLFITQFCGVFNDNAFKLSMLTLISYHLGRSQGESEHYQVIAGAIFILPYFFFSATAGQLADKYDKATLTRFIKLFEVLLMAFGGFAIAQGNILFLMLVLMGMGIHSTFFGPIKYAILPDHLLREQLLPATAVIEASTFIAILLGTTLGTLSIGHNRSDIAFSLLLVNSCAIIGFIASFFIPHAPSKSRNLKVDYNFLRATKLMLKSLAQDYRIMPATLGLSWFWLIGAVILTKLPDYTHYVLGADTSVFAFILALFSIGIAIGSLSVNWFLRSQITLRYVPISIFFVSVFAYDLYWSTPDILDSQTLVTLGVFFNKMNNIRISLDFFLFSFFGGFFVVPLYTYLQVCSPEDQRARVIAANNILNALAMVLGSALVMVMLALKLSIPYVFLIMGHLNALVAVLFWFMLRWVDKRLQI